MIKTYDPATTKLVLCSLELMIKGTSYTWSSACSFHAHIAKQVELYCLEWSNTSEIRHRETLFLSTQIYAKHHLLAHCPRQPLYRAGNRTRVRILGAVNLGIILAVVPVKRKGVLFQPAQVSRLPTGSPNASLSQTKKSYSGQHFDASFHRHTLLPWIRPQAYQWTKIYQTFAHAHCFVCPRAPSTATSAIICHILASRSDQPNAFRDKIPVPTALKVHMWSHLYAIMMIIIDRR